MPEVSQHFLMFRTHSFTISQTDQQMKSPSIISKEDDVVMRSPQGVCIHNLWMLSWITYNIYSGLVQDPCQMWKMDQHAICLRPVYPQQA